MRIITGLARGVKLQAVKGVRSTTERARHAIFSILGDAVSGARVLDLFSGVGTLGIEALSRGASSAILVDHEANCSRCIQHNLTKTKLSAMVCTLDVFHFLNFYTEPASFDLVFADPPYAKYIVDKENLASKLCNSQSLIQAVAPHGIFILEVFQKFHFPKNCGWIPLIEKRLSETYFFFLTKLNK